MAKAIREPDVEEYLEIARKGDYDAVQKFADECFGTGDDLNEKALDEFAKEVLPIIEKEVQDMIENTPEATEEMVAAAKDVADGTTEATVVDVKKEAANDDTDEAKVESSEATDESK